jgi:DNA polymerase (family 10)
MPPINAELARLFAEMAAVMELTGANPFKTAALNKAARTLRDLTFDVGAIAGDKKKLMEIDGIGEGMAGRIAEFHQTGRISEHEALIATIPPGLLQVTRIPGVGPKTAKLLWEKCGVVDLASLKEKIECGKLAGIPRMGEKTIQNILKSLEFVEKASERTRIGIAMPLAESIVEHLAGLDGVERVQYAGSLRRGCETIGDIDIIACGKDPAALAEAFATMAMVEQVLTKGETKVSVRIHRGMQVDLRIVPLESFGAALLYFTGSKEHNVALRERAIKRGMTLNEYGLFPDDQEKRQRKRTLPPSEGGGAGVRAMDEPSGDSPTPQPSPSRERGKTAAIASQTEEDIYRALDLSFIPPELRENRGEFRAELPQLIEFNDIKAELHAHTRASDGKFTIEELAAEAKRRGFHTIAVTDHSKSSALAGGLSPDALRAHIDAVRAANERVEGITILAGSEVDILADGSLDYDDDLLAQLDIVIASPHAGLKHDPDRATARLLRAVKHPLVHIIGHPTGRLIGSREGISPRMDEVIAAAVEHDTALEINANYRRLDLRDTHVRAAVEAGAKIAINCDSHITADFDNLRYGVMTARRGWLPAELCINTWPSAKLMKWLKGKR